jgi:hypothetical protein
MERSPTPDSPPITQTLKTATQTLKTAASTTAGRSRPPLTPRRRLLTHSPSPSSSGWRARAAVRDRAAPGVSEREEEEGNRAAHVGRTNLKHRKMGGLPTFERCIELAGGGGIKPNANMRALLSNNGLATTRRRRRQPSGDLTTRRPRTSSRQRASGELGKRRCCKARSHA